MTDETQLRAKAHEALRAGTVPNRRLMNVWAGQGCGACCAICSDPLKPDELEYELELSGNSDGCGVRDYHMHIACFAAWERERQNLQVVCGGTSNDDLPSSGNETNISGRERKADREEEVP